jgi:transposase
MEALRQRLPLPDCLVIGDSKLLSAEVIPKLLGQGVHFLAPLPRSPELDAEYLGLDKEGFQRLAYLAQRQERLPPEQQTEYLGQEVPYIWVDPKTGKRWPLRRLYVISSEERATCCKVRSQQRARTEAELTKLEAGLGKRQLKTAAQVQARVEQVLKARRVGELYRVSVRGEGKSLQLTWEVEPEALSRAEALDGYYVLLGSLPVEQGDSSALLRRWKRETVIERRFSDWKGPLRVRPVFVTSNARRAALVLLLHLALMIYCLLEREARRQLVTQGRQKMERLLAGHVAAVPTGENILMAFEHLYLIVEADEQGRHSEMSAMSPEQRELWHLLGIQTPVWS